MERLKSSQIFASLAAVAGLVVAFGFLYNQTNVLIGVVALIAIFLIMLYRPNVALYLIAATYPLTGLEFIYGSINVPYVDLIALLLFVAWALRSLWKFVQGELRLTREDFPGWFFFSFFVLAGALSLLNVESAQFSDSLKYLFRPMIFFYLVYLVLPMQYIKDKGLLLTLLKVMFWLGVVISVGGLWNFIFFDPAVGLRRVRPFGIGGVNPLEFNHNLVAETLVALIPIGGVLFWLEKDAFRKNLYLILTGVITLASILTFSRAGWLALLIEVIVMLYLFNRARVNQIFSRALSWVAILSIFPFALLFWVLNTTHVAQGSNLNRLKLIEIAWEQFTQQPIFGAGVGTFVNHVEQVQWYIIEYGTALDAHGFFFKTLAETGIVGTFGFVGLLGYLFYVLFTRFDRIKNREWQIIMIGLVAACVGVVVFQWFNTSYYLARMWWFFGLAFAAMAIIRSSGLLKAR